MKIKFTFKHDLYPMNNQKSYYGKASVFQDNFGNTYLVSYGTPILAVPNDDDKDYINFQLMYAWNTMTTTKHVKSFIAMMLGLEYDDEKVTKQLAELKAWANEVRKGTSDTVHYLSHNYARVEEITDNRNDFMTYEHMNRWQEAERVFKKGGAFACGKADSYHRNGHWYVIDPDGKLHQDREFFTLPNQMTKE